MSSDTNTAARRGLTRRGFIKAGAAAAVAGVAAGSLTGCGQGQVVSGSTAAGAGAAATANPATQRIAPSWLGTPPEVDESAITETVDVDVVVVGLGTAGVPAVISAAENGARVLGIDSQAAIFNVREDVGAINSSLQRASFAEFPEFEIDPMEALEDIVRYANGFVNYDLVKLWADESGAMIDWITQICERNGDFRMNFEGSIGTQNGQARDRAWATSHSPEALTEDADFGADLGAYAEELGATLRFNTTFVKCEQRDDGRVTGIICRDDIDQHYLRVNASGGVILATGGYGNNTEMMEARQAWNQRLRINTGNGGNPTGDGIKAALWCGATMDALGAAVTFNRAACKPDETAGANVNGRWFWFGEQPFLKVNLLGKRFCNESGPYDYMLHSAFLQPSHTYVDIFDSNYPEQVRQMNEVGCCRLYPFDNGAPSNMPIDAMPAMLQGLEEAGYLQRADTIEELAEKLNLPVEATAETFRRYNEFARSGRDDDYHKEPYRLMELNHPPCFGIRTGAWFLCTLDGCPVNTDMHPVTEAGDQIEGLFVVGNDSGGFFAVSYPNLFTGLAAGRSMTFGRRAGMLAAQGR